MTKEQLQAIKDRCEAATPGEWAYFRNKYDDYKLSVPLPDTNWTYPLVSLEPNQGQFIYDNIDNDLTFIAHARKDIPALIAEVERLTAPMKPIAERTLVGDYRCPNCNAAFITDMGITNYCGNCGQKLDWSDTEPGGRG